MNKYYQLSSKSHPELNKYGTLKEIYDHVREQGYTGETSIQFGYPLPTGADIVIEESHIKKPNSLRLSHEVWHIFDKIADEKKGFSNRVDAISYLVRLYEQMVEFGPVKVQTSEGMQEFDSLREFVELKPFFEDQGYDKGFEILFED